MTPIILPDGGVGLTLTQAIAALKERGYQYLDDTTATLFLNAAKTQFEDAYPWPWLETTVTGTAPLVIDDLKYVLYVVDSTNGFELVGVDGRDVAFFDPAISTAGTAQFWWLDNLTLNTWPTSTATLFVRYVKTTSVLGLATDQTQIPQAYQSLWIDMAVIEAAKDDENYVAVQQLRSEVNGKLQTLIEQAVTRNRQNGGMQQVTYASGDW